MAKKSVFNRNLKRQRLVDNQQQKRAKLKAQWLSTNAKPEDKEAAFMQLQKMPRNTAAVRLRIRCALTGRPRGVFRRFGVSRTKLREMAMNGEIPGVVKSSW